MTQQRWKYTSNNKVIVQIHENELTETNCNTYECQLSQANQLHSTWTHFKNVTIRISTDFCEKSNKSLYSNLIYYTCTNLLYMCSLWRSNLSVCRPCYGTPPRVGGTLFEKPVQNCGLLEGLNTQSPTLCLHRRDAHSLI